MDNDAGGITTYSLVAAQFGLPMLWSLVPITLILVIVLEMGARMGVHWFGFFRQLKEIYKW